MVPVSWRRVYPPGYCGTSRIPSLQLGGLRSEFARACRRPIFIGPVPFPWYPVLWGSGGRGTGGNYPWLARGSLSPRGRTPL